MRLVVRLVVLAALFVAAAASPAGAQVSASATVAPATVGINRQFAVSVEVVGAQQLDANPAPPDLGDFAHFLGSGSSTSIQMMNGRTNVSVTIDFRFQATKLGSFSIPPIKVRAGGGEVQTQTLSITVAASPPPAAQGPSESDVAVAPEDLFITATPSKRRVYVNEPVVVEYRIFARVNVEGYNIVKRPSSPGFWVEDLEDARPATERVVRNGREYVTAVIDRVALFPTGVGRKVVEPLSVEAQVRMQRAQRDPFDDFFSMGFATRVPVVIATDSLTLDVQPFPAAGRPDDFTGFAGSLNVSASLDKNSGRVDEAITYRLHVRGEGNLKTLPDPGIAFPADFEVYPPQVSQKVDRTGGRVTGSKTYEYVIIPRGPGARVIPAVTFSYYDLDRARYATARVDSMVVTVTGTASSGPVMAGRDRAGVAPLRQDIRFIRIAAPRLKRRGQTLFGNPVFWFVAIVPLVALAGAAGIKRHHDRLSGDVAFARGRRASKVARHRLAKARAAQSPQRAREFHAEVGKALQGFLGDKLNVAEAGMIRDAMAPHLSARGVSGEIVEAYFGCLDACDRYRFAPAEVTPDEMQALLVRAERAMAGLDQALGR